MKLIYLISLLFLISCASTGYKSSSKISSLDQISNHATVIIALSEGTGSAFFIKPRLLVTNYHVIEKASENSVIFYTKNNKVGKGLIVATDKNNDLALILTEKNYPFYFKVKRHSFKTPLGSSVTVVGSPRGLVGTITKGHLSAIRKKEETSFIREDKLQISAPVSYGSSGSPVLIKDPKTKYFHVIGVATSIIEKAQNLNFATPSERIWELYLKNRKKIDQLSSNYVFKKTNISLDEEVDESKITDPKDQFDLWLKYSWKENSKALDWLKKAAKQKYPTATYVLGSLYRQGHLLPKDLKKSIRLIKEAAKQGYASAQKSLGISYIQGDGVPKDFKKAFHWSEKSFKQGSSSAEVSLHSVWAYSKNKKEDFKLLKKLAREGNVYAQFNVADLYKRDDKGKKALYWFKKAAKQGDGWAQHELGFMYCSGYKGAPKNFKKGIYWYKKSAVQGREISQFTLGDLYEVGYCGSKDYVQAYKWYSLSLNQGGIGSEERLSELKLKMSSDEIREAERLVKER